MIGCLFEFAGDIVEVRVDGNSLYFRNSQYGSQLVPIEGIQLNQAGAIKEFPDLENDEEWKAKSIQRLKDNISNLGGEMEKIKYVIKELRPFGYVPKFIQKEGWRPIKVHA